MTIDCIDLNYGNYGYFFSTQLLLYTSTLPVATQSLHPIYRTTRKGWSRWSARSSWLGWNTRREGRHCNSLCRMNIPANIWTWGVCYLCTVTNNFWQHFWCWQMAQRFIWVELASDFVSNYDANIVRWTIHVGNIQTCFENCHSKMGMLLWPKVCCCCCMIEQFNCGEMLLRTNWSEIFPGVL